MLGAAAAFGLARLLGWPFIRRILSAGHRERLAAWSKERGAVGLLISRLIPVIAFNLINYAAGLAGISWWTFLWTTGLGILPLTALFTVMGDRLLTVLPLGVLVLIGWIIVEAATNRTASRECPASVRSTAPRTPYDGNRGSGRSGSGMCPRVISGPG